jgi:hypothetical protein
MEVLLIIKKSLKHLINLSRILNKKSLKLMLLQKNAIKLTEKISATFNRQIFAQTL